MIVVRCVSQQDHHGPRRLKPALVEDPLWVRKKVCSTPTNAHKFRKKRKTRFWRQLDSNPHPKKFAKTIYYLKWCSIPLSHYDFYIINVKFGINKPHDMASYLLIQTVLFCFTTFRINQTSIVSLLTNLQILWTKCLKLEQCAICSLIIKSWKLE